MAHGLDHSGLAPSGKGMTEEICSNHGRQEAERKGVSWGSNALVQVPGDVLSSSSALLMAHTLLKSSMNESTNDYSTHDPIPSNP